MKRIAVEEVMRIQKERYVINELDFREIVWTYLGWPIQIDKKILNDFELSGLSNCDFITSNILPDRPWQFDN